MTKKALRNLLFPLSSAAACLLPLQILAKDKDLEKK